MILKIVQVDPIARERALEKLFGQATKRARAAPTTKAWSLRAIRVIEIIDRLAECATTQTKRNCWMISRRSIEDLHVQLTGNLPPPNGASKNQGVNILLGNPRYGGASTGVTNVSEPTKFHELSTTLQYTIRQRSAARSQVEKAGWTASLQRVVASELAEGKYSHEKAVEILKANHAYGTKGRAAIAGR